MAVILKQDDSLTVTRDGSSCGKARTWKEGIFWDQPTHSCEWTPLPGASSGHRGAVWSAKFCCVHTQLFWGYSSQKQQKKWSPKAGNTNITIAKSIPEKNHSDVLATKMDAVGTLTDTWTQKLQPNLTFMRKSSVRRDIEGLLQTLCLVALLTAFLETIRKKLV